MKWIPNISTLKLYSVSYLSGRIKSLSMARKRIKSMLDKATPKSYNQYVWWLEILNNLDSKIKIITNIRRRKVATYRRTKQKK